MNSSVLIVCKDEHADEIRACVLEHVHPKVMPYVEVISDFENIQSGNKNYLKIIQRAIDLSEKSETTRCKIVIDKEIKCNSSNLALHYSVVLKPSSAIRPPRRDFDKSLIEKVLDEAGLSVQSFSEILVKDWIHGKVGTLEVSAWLKQFSTLGVSSDIGKTLLRSLDFTSQLELGKRLFNVDVFGDNDHFAVLSNIQEDASGKITVVVGKSAAAIANLIGKQVNISSSNCHNEPADALEASKPGSSVHFFEDGLYTATEMVGVLESLLDMRKASGRKNKVRPLKNPDLLRDRKVFLRFAVGCDYGISLLKRFISENNLKNIEIYVSENKIVNVLSEAGQLEIASQNTSLEKLWESGIPDGMVTPSLYVNCMVWGSQEKTASAREFCRKVGRQLFFNYLEAQVRKRKWTMWPEVKIDKCAHGMWGLGLALAFSHSVPKSTIPLFWASGPVSVGNKTIEWKPLFPNAA